MKYVLLFSLALAVFGLSAYLLQEQQSAKDAFGKTSFRAESETQESPFVSQASAHPGELMNKTGDVEGIATVVFSNNGKEAEVFANLPDPVGGYYELQVQQPNKRIGTTTEGVVLNQQKAGFIGKISIPKNAPKNSQLVILFNSNENSRTRSSLFTIDLR